MANVDGNQFGARLRELRERTRPEEIGLPAGGRRRVRGLRREELAAFSNMSVDYLTRLEQGHARNPSSDIVAALGRAMRLPRLELELLYQLAGHAGPDDLEVPRHLTPGVSRLIDRLGSVPVAAYDATWTLISCNPAWRSLNGPATSTAGFNLVHAVFTDGPLAEDDDPAYRERLRRSLVADLRIAAARYPADHRMQQLLRNLFARSAAFATAWSEGRAHTFTTEPKQMNHPTFGRFWVDCDVLTASDGDARIVFYTAAHGTPGHQALEELEHEPRGTAREERKSIDVGRRGNGRRSS